MNGRPQSPTHPVTPEKLAVLLELSRAFNALMPLEELLSLVNGRTREVLGAESCAILLLDSETGELYFPVSSDLSPEVEERFRSIRFPAGKGVAGWVLEHGEAAIVLVVTLRSLRSDGLPPRHRLRGEPVQVLSVVE